MTVNPDFRIWDGVYATFADAPAAGPGFDGPIWRDRSLRAARAALACAHGREPLDYALRQRNIVLPTLTAAVGAEQARINILDFGGGLGTGYIVLAKAMPDAIDRVDYAVVETDTICCTGRELFAGIRAPIFHGELPATGRFDIVHAASTIQYIEDWRNLIERLADYGARYLSLAELFIGEFATYATLQNYYDSRIRHWFFNAGEFVEEVERNGYQLALTLECDSTRLGRHGPLLMDNFPPSLRIASTKNLLFRRRDVRP